MDLLSNILIIWTWSRLIKILPLFRLRLIDLNLYIQIETDYEFNLFLYLEKHRAFPDSVHESIHFFAE